MDSQQLLDMFTQILKDLLDDDSIVLTQETTRGDVDDWDSFNYVNFIVAVETELGIKFRIADVEAFETVGDIVADALTRLNK
jgi:acyl carrier protein